MKNTTIIIVKLLTIAILQVNQAIAQVACNSNCQQEDFLIISTGVNSAGNSLPVGTLDPYWKLMNTPPLNAVGCSGAGSLTSQMNPPNAYTASHAGWGQNGWANQVGAWALSPVDFGTASDGFGCNNLSRFQPFIFDRPFCLCDDDTLKIDVTIKGDDRVSLELIDENGTIIGSSATYSYPNSSPVAWNYNTYLSAGKYRIRAKLVNVSNTTTGFSVLGNISSIKKVLSNTSPNCCQDLGLVIQKIIDNDCSGTFTEGDVLGSSNWEFHILDGLGNIISSVSTDEFGVAIVTGLVSGEYTIEEVDQESFYAFNNSVQLSLNSENELEFINFYNCPGEPPVIPPNLNCCKVDLEIFNAPGTPNPLPATQSVHHGIPMSYAKETFVIHEDATIPITEMRVVVTDIQYAYNYDACATCVNNPALWGTIIAPVTPIGGANGLSHQNPDYMTMSGSLVTNFENKREIIWSNPNGAMLRDGDAFEVHYLLPPASEIPCCVTSVKICTKIIYKDANCQVCEIPTCSVIELKHSSKKQSNNLGEHKSDSHTCECEGEYVCMGYDRRNLMCDCVKQTSEISQILDQKQKTKATTEK